MSDAASPTPFRVRGGWATDVGHVRDHNEDSVLVAPPVFMVADGMGGHDAGEVASAIAVEEFGDLAGSEDLRIEDLGAALREAERRIHEIGTGGPLSAGTTVALAATMLIDGAGYWVVLNLGDSRVYRLSGDVFEQVSVDHSVVQELVDAGELTAAEAKVHPYRHMITRALGAGPQSDPDYWLIPAEAGDRLLVCSDGLSGELDDETIERVLRRTAGVQEACDVLVELALAAGGHDNVTVVIVEAIEVPGAEGDGDTGPAPRAPERVDDAGEDTVPRRLRRDGGEP
ncbi:protein phosphatase 2C domain-containing protein [Brachybacterium huguangmaarense]|uniref:Protein phosphatase 2C domain-containing protein n=1 Tax=Brachybacterium huguangmaarense TaxID=1652028 RepID=A0ABY6FXH2_9MICO|nr:PP2C family serine/threonine-protein phosphatase [Brachybacterium huguangmaarense]UYG15618.1 protein phosphatase 2C domain-containing protein [Brachybacterium huguangmaarense]